jgi:hypothetical protein
MGYLIGFNGIFHIGINGIENGIPLFNLSIYHMSGVFQMV